MANRYRIFVSSNGTERTFATFQQAERWARRRVAASRHDDYAERVEISHEGEAIAVVMLDGADRVWTDMR